MNSKNLNGLQGWLILVGLGLIISPIRMFYIYLPIYSPIFTDGTWEALTTVDSETYDPLWGPLISFEIASNSIFLFASFYLLYLFFGKNYLFPKIYIVLVIISVIFIPLDAWFVTFVIPDEPMFDPNTIKEISRSLISLFVWVPYMLVSKRVKATFILGKTGKQSQPVTDSQ